MFDALDGFYASKEDSAYYTCFVDENFYEKHPDPRITASVHLKDFINCKDRIFSLATDLEFSQDGKSAVSQSVYTLKQRSIACFYDMNDETLNKFGLESVEEQKHILYEPEPGEREVWDGRKNTWQKLDGQVGNCNMHGMEWGLKKSPFLSGFILRKDGSLKESRPISGQADDPVIMLIRNRDLNGNGYLDEEELRWYVPAIGQLVGMWLGEPAMAKEAALWKSSFDIYIGADGKKINKDPVQGYTASTYGPYSTIWSELGGYISHTYLRHMISVRSLGSGVVSGRMDREVSSPYYKYDEASRTLEVFLADEAMRSFSYRELQPHNERDTQNRLYKKFQLAQEPMLMDTIAEFECTDPSHLRFDKDTPSKVTWTGTTLKLIEIDNAKRDKFTIAQDYHEAGDGVTPAGAWRLPNERELTLIQLAFNFFQDEDNLPFSPMVKPGDKDAVGDAYGWYNPLSLTCDLSDKRNHNFKHRLCAVFHCRTAYSYSRYYPGRHEYTPTGYILNYWKTDSERELLKIRRVEMHMMPYYSDERGMVEEDKEERKKYGRAGVFCVRDVRY